MDDREFYDRVDRAMNGLARDPGQPRPGREAVARAERQLEELARDPGTEGHREREGALSAAYGLLNRVRDLAELQDF
jgi:hypothetical protein